MVVITIAVLKYLICKGCPVDLEAVKLECKYRVGAWMLVYEGNWTSTWRGFCAHVACHRHWTREVRIPVFCEIHVVSYMSSGQDPPAEHMPLQYSAGWTVRWGKGQS